MDVSTWRPDLAEGYLAGQVSERQIRRRRRWSWTMAAVSSVLVLACLAIEVRSVLAFGAWQPWATPRHIRHCGQDYRQESGSQARSLEQLHVVDLRKVMSGPHFQPVYEPVFTLGRYDKCGPDLLLRSGSGYRDYSDGIYG